MKIALIGSGNMGGTLGRRWAALGHRVIFGTRDPNSERMNLLLHAAGANAQAGTIREAVAFADVILLAVPPGDVERALAEAGDMDGKILINCTNRYDGASSDAEVRRLARNSRVVRAFHTLPWEVLENPRYEAGTVTAFISGDDPDAVEIIAKLTRDIGLDPVDVGGAEAMAKTESAIGMLWSVLSPGFGREYGLSVLRR